MDEKELMALLMKPGIQALIRKIALPDGAVVGTSSQVPMPGYRAVADTPAHWYKKE